MFQKPMNAMAMPAMPMTAKPAMLHGPKHAFGKKHGHSAKPSAQHAAQIKAAVQAKFPDLGQTAMVSQMKG